jgi:hypothetical protein
MGRIVKWLVVLSAVGVAVTLASYAGAMLTAGKLLGPAPPLTSRTVQLAFEEVNHMPGDPPAWVFTYQASQLPGWAPAGSLTVAEQVGGSDAAARSRDTPGG